ncbi:MAG: precorrin-6y C5,15-methyltransferase (decarboxylating), CbiE subunit [Rhizobium sp.]|nr:precorrin-6y C5,15-methyltransferase (decarboxylating), CbiE subunit [Rhizobium sp.]
MAELVCGGKRHLELANSLVTGERHQCLSPIERSVEFITSARRRNVCVLASGDPFFFGMGATLSRTIDSSEMFVIPAPSSFCLAASRLGWPLQDLALVSLHGRPLDLIRPHLQPGARILALTSDEKGPSELAALLTGNGFGQSGLVVLEALGGANERVTKHVAERFSQVIVSPLNICAIDVAAGEGARVLPLASGLEDGLFEHDGQITKREIRAITLSALAPRKGELLWDIGGGSGSISIEWMLAHPAMRAIAIEADAERAERIARNARAFGVPGLQVVTGGAPSALSDLPAPDAIFVGGGGSDPGVMDAAMSALTPGGRLVANGVTLEMEAVLLGLQARYGGSLIRIDILRAGPVGAMQGWRPAMPVTQWSWIKASKDQS